MSGDPPTSPSPPRLELRLSRGRVAVGFPPQDLGEGLALVDLELEVDPGPAPVDPAAGTAALRALPCALARLEVSAKGPLPGADALGGILGRALALAGWPAPVVDGLAYSSSTGDEAPRCAWRRPADDARLLLDAAALARDRGDGDAALRLALAGHAALAAGLPAEGETALRAALDLGLGRDDSREAWSALVTLSRARGDAAAERHALAGLVPAAPTGERPGLLLRLSALDAGAGDAAAARTHAEEARTLAPRDPSAVGACLELARGAGDVPATVDLLDRLSSLDPDRAGDLLLERARLLARSGQAPQADAGFQDALGRLPPSRSLADEHAAFRRAAPAPVGRFPWGEPLEAFAARAPDAAEAAQALRDAALLAGAQGDRASALRAARRAHERAGDVGFVGALLAELLHAGGSVSEALELHRTLLREVGPSLDPAALADRLLALAELAEEAGDRGLAVESLDRLLDLRPVDADLVEWRFRVDPDRARALERLAADADRLRSRLRRVGLLVRAAAAARAEAHDPGRESDLLRRAAEAAAGIPAAELPVARARVDAARAAASGPDAPPAAAAELAGALLALATASEAAGDAPGAGSARAEAFDLAFRDDAPPLALPGLLALEAAAGRTDPARASALSRRVARALLDAGDGPGADAALRRAMEGAHDDDLAWAEIEALTLSRGDAGAPVLAELLAARSARAAGPARAELLVALARVQRGPLGDAEGALRSVRSALLAAPGDPSAEAELDRLLAATGRVADLGQALLERAVRETEPDERARLRLRAAEILTDAPDDATRSLAVPALLAILAEPPPARAILLEASARLASLGRGEEGAPYLLALCKSDPFDAGAARALAQALDAAPLVRARAFQEIAAAAPAGPTRAGHLRDAGAAFAEAGQADRIREVTRATFEAWPVDDRAFRAALSDAAGDVDATDAILATRAAAVATEAAACHRTRADLLLSAGRPGPAARAYESCLASDPKDGGALLGLAEARSAEGDGAGALAAARRAADLAAADGRAADRRRALDLGSRLAASLGDRGEDAAALLEALALVRIEEGPGDPEVGRLATRAAAALEAAGEELRAAALLSRAGVPSGAGELDLSLELEPHAEAPAAAGAPGKAPSIADLLRPLLASARSLAESGELGAAYARLKLAREIDPDHLDLTLMLARVAEKLGNLEEAVSLGEAHADALALTDRLSAAVRYRELADTARSRLGEPDRATALLEKAAALEPGDPATEEALASLRASRRGHALDLLARNLDALRDRPGDAEAARAVAVLSRELASGESAPRERAARAERAAVAYALSRFVQRLGPADRPLDLASPIGPEIRARVAQPGADGPTGRLVALLAPYLEPLFPVDLSRHGVGPADRLAPGAAPAVHRAVDAATRALGGRVLALFAGKRPGLHGVLENTRPPSVILGADAAALPAGALAFLAARAVALAGSGHALLGKFAPRDVVILCELAVRFAGGEPPGRGLPLDRAGAFLAALERAVPPATRDLVQGLGPAAAEELAVLEPGPFVAAIEGTAARLALLHSGDLHGALTVLSRLQRSGAVPPPDPAAALARPDLVDLARFALSDAYLELRGMLLGWP